MGQYERNLATLRRCQLCYDNMEPPEYWDDSYMMDPPDEEEDEDDDGFDGITGEG